MLAVNCRRSLTEHGYVPVRSSEQDCATRENLLRFADALDFRVRSIVLRKEQRILVFFVLNYTGSPAAQPLGRNS